MKKLILSILMVLAIGFSSFAQNRVEKKTVKVKHTSSFGQKVHNTFHKHHKHYNGYKIKTKVRK
jgi:ABC-type metal ion transport system substrate-binding protein